MVRGGKETQKRYLKAWRAKHPNYGRDWQRAKRGTPAYNQSMKGTIGILGIRVRPNLLEIFKLERN